MPSDSLRTPYPLKGHTLQPLSAEVARCMDCDCYHWPREPRRWAPAGRPYAFQAQPPACVARPPEYDPIGQEAT